MIDELRSLRSDMSSMLDRMEKLRIYLDTGTLVGEIAGPLDSALGQISIHKRRGN